MHRAYLPAWTLALPPLRSAVLTVVIFRSATAAEARESMNAPGEAEFAGVLMALPWIAILCAEVLAITLSLCAGARRSRAGQVASVSFLTAMTLAIGGGWIAWSLSWGAPLPSETFMMFALVLPLAPLWMAIQGLSPSPARPGVEQPSA